MSDLADLISAAEAALDAAEESDPGEFLSYLDSYLELLEQADLEALAVAKEGLEKLLSLHKELGIKAELVKADVGAQLAELGPKAKALKAYTNRLPSRINIAGTRKG